MTIPTLHTARLTLRPFTPADAPAYFAIRRQPDVARFLTGAPHETVEESARTIARIAAHWADKPFGIWAVIERATMRLIGHCGLWSIPETDDTEIAYAFDPSAWGQGYATEAGAVALRDGFDRARLPLIYGLALPENRASQRVLQKLGMKFEGVVSRYYHTVTMCYHMANPALPEPDPQDTYTP
ncbi:MAG: GNAT family N-acetyltransferase [bacterium]|nr:GNAT family N-acetyltransferase [bacterium]